MNKTIIAIVVIAVVGLGGYLFLTGTYRPAPSVSQSPTSQAPAEEEKEYVVTYTNAGYTPATLKVKNGGTVTFKNQSSRSMWTASAMHPSHRAYPTTGGCLGSTFDACQGVQPGNSWSFKFDIAGTWKYHDHLNPGAFGAIVVE
jgi:plastocyanin